MPCEGEVASSVRNEESSGYHFTSNVEILFDYFLTFLFLFVYFKLTAVNELSNIFCLHTIKISVSLKYLIISKCLMEIETLISMFGCPPLCKAHENLRFHQ